MFSGTPYIQVKHTFLSNLKTAWFTHFFYKSGRIAVAIWIIFSDAKGIFSMASRLLKMVPLLEMDLWNIISKKPFERRLKTKIKIEKLFTHRCTGLFIIFRPPFVVTWKKHHSQRIILISTNRLLDSWQPPYNSNIRIKQNKNKKIVYIHKMNICSFYIFCNTSQCLIWEYFQKHSLSGVQMCLFFIFVFYFNGTCEKI